MKAAITWDKRGNESVALAYNCFYKSWIMRVIPQRLPDLANCCIDAALGIQKCGVPPKRGNYPFSRNKPSALFEQEKQKI